MQAVSLKDIESRMYGARDRSSSRAADDDNDDNNNTSSLAARRASRQATPKYEPIETKKIECPECGQKFVSERAMNIHLSTMHEKTTKVPLTSNPSFRPIGIFLILSLRTTNVLYVPRNTHQNKHWTHI